MSVRVVIVGGGAVGSSIAYWLTREPGFAVTVVERDPTYARASSALSASAIRQQYSTPVNIEIGRFGVVFLKEIGRWLSVGGEPPDIGFVESGYLFLATGSGLQILRDNHAVQRTHGADVALLTPADLLQRFPWMSTAGIVAASLGLSGEGWFDGYGLLQAFRRKAIDQGVHYLPVEFMASERMGDCVSAIVCGDGQRIGCDILVNAAGPWSGQAAARLGTELPVRGRARSVFVLDCPDPLPGLPLVIDSSGAWIRREGRYFIAGMSPSPDRDPDDAPLDVDHDQFEEMIWPALAARIPALEQLKVVGSWAGYYDYNTVDQNGLVGRHPSLANAFCATGFSGHGIQQSPAVGRAVSELIRHGRYETLDLTALAPERLQRNQPLVEHNII